MRLHRIPFAGATAAFDGKPKMGMAYPLFMALTGILAASLFAFPAMAKPADEKTAASPPPKAPVAARRKVSPYHPVSVPDSGSNYYRSLWGIDNLLVRSTASDNLIRFSYRVVDPERAKILGDKRATPYLYGQRSRAVLHIPVMDKVGQLRQSGSGQAGNEYWMVFSNKGNQVKRGDRVNVIIGSFHVDGLMVE